MGTGETIWLHRAALEEPKFDGAFNCDEQRLDDERIVAGIPKGLSVGEQRPSVAGSGRRPRHQPGFSSMKASMCVLLIGDDLLADLVEAVAPVYHKNAPTQLYVFCGN